MPITSPSAARPSTSIKTPPSNRARWLTALAVAVFAFAPLAPMAISGSWPHSHDGPLYFPLYDAFRDAIAHGVLYPRWLPDLFGGYGYPVFAFYQPGLFYFLLPFGLLTGSPLLHFQLGLYALTALGGTGMYRLCRQFADRRTALFACAVFLLTPYLYVELYVRGDMGEAAALLLAPWPIYFLVRMHGCWRQSGQGGVAAALGLAASLAAMLLIHPTVGPLYMPALCLIAAVLAAGSAPQARWRLAGQVAGAIVIALALSAPFWFSVITLRGAVQLSVLTEASYVAANNVVYPQQLFARTWGFGYSMPDADDSMPFQLGLPHFVLAAAGLILARRQKLVLAAGAAYALMIAAMLPWSAPLWRLPVLELMQFPWRMLAYIAALQAICAAGLGVAFNDLRRWGSALAALLVAGVAAWQPLQFTMVPAPPIPTWADVRRQAAEPAGSDYGVFGNPYMPRTASAGLLAAPRRGSEFMAVEGAGQAVAAADSTRHRLHYSVRAREPMAAVIQQIYLPGWAVEVNGKRVSESDLKRQLTADGRMRIELPAGEHDIAAWYDGPPGWLWRNIGMAVAILLAFAGVMGLARRPG
jgi:hypothetical protein